MTVFFNMEMKTGFFDTEISEVAIDSHNQLIRIEKNIDSKIIKNIETKTTKNQRHIPIDLIRFSEIEKITFNPYMNDEIEIMTTKNAYVGCIFKEAINKGVVDFVKLSFGDKFREIR